MLMWRGADKSEKTQKKRGQVRSGGQQGDREQVRWVR
jgi:hypothetical protein